MTAFTHSRFARLRHAGASRYAASWRMPVVAIGMGTSVQWAGDDQAKREVQLARPNDRMQQQTTSDATSCRTSEKGSLEAGHSGAGSGFRGDAP